jgi:hypothetical protein
LIENATAGFGPSKNWDVHVAFSFSLHETFALLVHWYAAAEPGNGSRL